MGRWSGVGLMSQVPLDEVGRDLLEPSDLWTYFRILVGRRELLGPDGGQTRFPLVRGARPGRQVRFLAGSGSMLETLSGLGEHCAGARLAVAARRYS